MVVWAWALCSALAGSVPGAFPVSLDARDVSVPRTVADEPPLSPLACRLPALQRLPADRGSAGLIESVPFKSIDPLLIPIDQLPFTSTSSRLAQRPPPLSPRRASCKSPSTHVGSNISRPGTSAERRRASCSTVLTSLPSMSIILPNAHLPSVRLSALRCPHTAHWMLCFLAAAPATCCHDGYMRGTLPPSLYEGEYSHFSFFFLTQIRDAVLPPFIHATDSPSSDRQATSYALSSPED